MNPIRCLFCLFASLIFLSAFSLAQDFPYDKSIWPDDLRIRGHVIVCGKGKVSEDVQNLFQRLAGSEPQIVAIEIGEVGNSQAADLESAFEDAGQFDVFQLGTDQKELPAELKKSIESANGIWIASNHVDNQLPNQLTELESLLSGRIDEGSVVLLSGDAANCAGSQHAHSVGQGVEVFDGLSLLPDCVISTDEDSSANLAAIAMMPTRVSVMIPENTSIVLSGRKIRTVGEGKVEFRLMANEQKSYRTLSVPQAENRRINPYLELVDLTAWRRDAIDRTLPEFPPAKPAKPFVENGTLVIVGGGGMPRGLFDEFVELAGGKDAKLVYVPCSESDTVRDSGLVNRWKQQVASATLFHTKDRDKADSDEEFLKPLKDATGIWFGGGRQWNFVDSYYGTEAHRLMLEVLDRGGVVGGSSAGASIQGEYLARANPVANFDIMAPGYERGMGFLEGVAIDQHFSQRGRQKDMTSLVDTYPQLLGIGIDEATAIIVQKSEAKVVGRGQVFFYDRNQPVIPGEDDFIALKAGEKFDLDSRKKISEE